MDTLMELCSRFFKQEVKLADPRSAGGKPRLVRPQFAVVNESGDRPDRYPHKTEVKQREWIGPHKEDNRRGKEPGAARAHSALEYAWTQQRAIALYPSHFGLVCLDIDSPTVALFAQRYPFHLYATRSRSAFMRVPKHSADGGHLWFQPPKDLDAVQGLKSFDLMAHHGDIRYDQWVFVPHAEWTRNDFEFIRFLTERVGEKLKAPLAPFPTMVFLPGTAKGSHRNTNITKHVWNMMAQTSDEWRTTFDASWMQLAVDCGYEAEQPGWCEAMLKRSWEKNKGRNPADGSIANGRMILAHDPDGVLAAFQHAEVDARYNVVKHRPEVKSPKFGWLPLHEDKGYLSFRLSECIANPDRGNTPWVIYAWIAKFHNLAAAVIYHHYPAYHPYQSILDAAQQVAPLGSEDSLFLSLMDLQDPEDLPYVLAMERHLLRVLYARINRHIRPGTVATKTTRCKVLMFLVGEVNSSKSELCRLLGTIPTDPTGTAGGDAIESFASCYITHDEKPFAETATKFVSIELDELDVQLQGISTRKFVKGMRNLKIYPTVEKFDYRDAYSRATGESHYLPGIMIATGNGFLPRAVVRDDGVASRIAYVRVKRNAAKRRAMFGPKGDFAPWHARRLQALARAREDHNALMRSGREGTLDIRVMRKLCPAAVDPAARVHFSEHGPATGPIGDDFDTLP